MHTLRRQMLSFLILKLKVDVEAVAIVEYDNHIIGISLYFNRNRFCAHQQDGLLMVVEAISVSTAVNALLLEGCMSRSGK